MLYESLSQLDQEQQPLQCQTISHVVIVAIDDFAVHGMVSLLDNQKEKYSVEVISPESFTLAQVDSIRPDILLLSHSATEGSMDELIRSITQVSSNTKVVLFGHAMNDTFLYQAMCAGARGYLNEKMRGDHLTNALDTVCQGGYWAERHILCQFISDKSMNDKIEDNAVKLFSRLTKREAEVLGKVLEGLSTHEIAERIYLSHQGVKAHLTNLFRKFEVKNRVQLILKALDEISPVAGLTEIASKSLKLKADKMS
jgi:DNA-binding NarL/FixJ family response regulator